MQKNAEQTMKEKADYSTPGHVDASRKYQNTD